MPIKITITSEKETLLHECIVECEDNLTPQELAMRIRNLVAREFTVDETD